MLLAFVGDGAANRAGAGVAVPAAATVFAGGELGIALTSPVAVPGAEQAQKSVVEIMAVRIEADVLRATVEQFRPNLCLEDLDRGVESHPRDAKRGGGSYEVQFFHAGNEVPQVGDLHKNLSEPSARVDRCSQATS